MQNNYVDNLVNKYHKYIPKQNLHTFKTKLVDADDKDYQKINNIILKNNIITFIFSCLFGCFGMDRFYLNDSKKANIKLLLVLSGALMVLMGYITVIIFMAHNETGFIGKFIDYKIFTGCMMIFCGIGLVIADGIYAFVDIFLCYRKCKIYNYNLLINVLSK